MSRDIIITQPNEIIKHSLSFEQNLALKFEESLIFRKIKYYKSYDYMNNFVIFSFIDIDSVKNSLEDVKYFKQNNNPANDELKIKLKNAWVEFSKRYKIV